jgi:hypothetical protein
MFIKFSLCLEGVKKMKTSSSKSSFYGYIKRFTIAHVVTFLVFGLIFMNVMSYSREFVQNETFTHFRPLDSPIVRAAILFQFLRGAFIASVLYPFRTTIIEHRWGWLILFGVIYGLTGLAAVNASPGSIEGMIYTEVSLKAHLIGMPEVITQSLAFSILFWFWERKHID